MRVSDLKLNYSAGPRVKPRPVHVQPSKANVHRVKTSVDVSSAKYYTMDTLSTIV